jgi:acetyl-CoA decarbonylase/synthase complex subunit gamma
MAFATKLVNREKTIQECPPLLHDDNKDAYIKLWALLKPPVKEITIGAAPHAVQIGGKDVLYRHELTYVNPTAIALDITDNMTTDEILQRVKSVEAFSYNYIGMNLTLDMIAIRATSNNPQRFAAAVKTYSEQSHLPVILCSLDPEIIENGLLTLGKSRPLIYAATKDNWQEMADLALMYNCPLVVTAPGDLDMLKSLAHTLIEYGVEDLVLDPGTYANDDLASTVTNFTMLRKAAVRENDEILGFPLLGIPLIAWLSPTDAEEVAVWHETWLASMLITRFADVLIMHSLDGWAQLPLTILRNNLYTDPRKPVAVEPGLRTYGNPDDQSPLFFTTNFALTYYTVAADIKSGGIDCYLLVVDSEGNSVESSVAGRKLTADKITEALNESNVKDIVKHNTLVIPGRAARLSGEIEEVSGWSVIVGPRDSSGIPKFVKENWPIKK